MLTFIILVVLRILVLTSYPLVYAIPSHSVDIFIIIGVLTFSLAAAITIIILTAKVSLIIVPVIIVFFTLIKRTGKFLLI